MLTEYENTDLAFSIVGIPFGIATLFMYARRYRDIVGEESYALMGIGGHLWRILLVIISAMLSCGLLPLLYFGLYRGESEEDLHMTPVVISGLILTAWLVLFSVLFEKQTKLLGDYEAVLGMETEAEALVRSDIRTYKQYRAVFHSKSMPELAFSNFAAMELKCRKVAENERAMGCVQELMRTFQPYAVVDSAFPQLDHANKSEYSEFWQFLIESGHYYYIVTEEDGVTFTLDYFEEILDNGQ
ncbi:MAG: hypothetical protein LBR60_01505 [Fibrobacter sp.]|nr:hypothetical protein [Fibrobacter sp.]